MSVFGGQLCGYIEFIVKMESKDGSVKRLIRVHLNAHKKSLQMRRHTEQSLNTSSKPQLRKVTFKSP